MEATRANMRKVYPTDKQVRQADGTTVTIIVPKPFAYSPATGERYSADPNDYWNHTEDEPLCDELGEPMLLAFERTSIDLID